MSGGHFDYQESYLSYIAEQIEQDIKYNDVDYDTGTARKLPHGYQHPPEVIAHLRTITAQLYQLKELLMEYDLYVSGDSSSLKRFLEAARAVTPCSTGNDSECTTRD